MARISPLMLAPPVIFAGFVIMAAVGMFTTNSTELRSTLIGKPAPAITEANLPGFEPVTAEALATGQVTLVNFWASWCAPCRLEHPQLMQLQAKCKQLLELSYNLYVVFVLLMSQQQKHLLLQPYEPT